MTIAPPGSAIEERWPTWTDFVDNWRAIDAHWFRDRVVNIFDNALARSNSGIAPIQGTLSFLQDVNSLEFYKSGAANLAASWESVRYPNLAVASASGALSTVTMRYATAGSGIVLQSDGVAAIEKLDAGLGTLLVGVAGATLHTGAAGNKSVLLATDATSLTIDSPVKIAGALSATGALSAPSLALSGALTAATATTTGQLRGATVVADGQSSGVTGLFGATALLGNKSGWAALQHISQSTGTGSGVFVGVDGSTSINAPSGVANTVNGTLNVNGPLNVSGYAAFSGGGQIGSGVLMGGLIVVGGRGPNAGDAQPNGTIWIQV